VDHTDIFHADGQVRDENYEFGSFLSSRMFHAGVRCMDCHDPHSARPILPGNQLCMRCHAPGGFPNAPVIQPEAHSFHKADSTGNQCVNCHMPQTVYMQRHWRHDHGFTIPDPLLTKEHGIPNACNRCHQDKDAGWALAATEKWYGEKMNRRTRERARTIAKARAGDPGARDGLLGILADDEIPYWKASAVGLLERWLREEVVGRAVLDQTANPHPLVRGSAARTLEILVAENDTRARESVHLLLEDPARLVRSAAAWTLRDSLDLQSAAGQDLRHMLQLNADQPSGQMQLAQFEAARRNLPMAIRHMETAISWDPNSPPFHHDLAMMHSLSGSTAKAIEKLRDAIKLAPREAEYHYKLGLAFSETGQMDQAIAALRETVRLEPRYARAWYNLGLALNGQGKVAEAIEALTQGEQAGPSDPGIPYALATILAQQGRKAEAVAATERALRASPDFAEAQQLLMMLRK
jgi:tetratricopeptide (TPR) repeat protein